MRCNFILEKSASQLEEISPGYVVLVIGVSILPYSIHIAKSRFVRAESRCDPAEVDGHCRLEWSFESQVRDNATPSGAAINRVGR